MGPPSGGGDENDPNNLPLATKKARNENMRAQIIQEQMKDRAVLYDYLEACWTNSEGVHIGTVTESGVLSAGVFTKVNKNLRGIKAAQGNSMIHVY